MFGSGIVFQFVRHGKLATAPLFFRGYALFHRAKLAFEPGEGFPKLPPRFFDSRPLDGHFYSGSMRGIVKFDRDGRIFLLDGPIFRRVRARLGQRKLFFARNRQAIQFGPRTSPRWWRWSFRRRLGLSGRTGQNE